MNDEDETSGANAPTKLDEATEAVRTTTEAVETTSQRIADAIKAGHRQRYRDRTTPQLNSLVKLDADAAS